MRLPAEQRRTQLLLTATSVFAERGYHDASMNDIAEAAGVTKPVLYQHFQSKRELYLEVLADAGQQLQTTIGAAIEAADGPRQQIESGFGAYFRWVFAHPLAFSILFGSGTAVDPEFTAAARRVEAAIATWVADLIVIDGLTADRRKLLATGIVGLAEATCRTWAEGARVSSTDVSLPAEPAELAAEVAELAWFGLRGIRSDRTPAA